MERGVQGLGDAPMPSETAKQSIASPKAITSSSQKSVISIVKNTPVGQTGSQSPQAAEFYHP